MNTDVLFKYYGRPVEVFTKEGEKIAESSAFISPLRYKNKMYLYGVNTEIGYNSQGYYLYIGPPDPDICAVSDGSYLLCMGEKYRIDRAERVYKGKNVFYIWAVIRVIVEIEEGEA